MEYCTSSGDVVFCTSTSLMCNIKLSLGSQVKVAIFHRAVGFMDVPVCSAVGSRVNSVWTHNSAFCDVLLGMLSRECNMFTVARGFDGANKKMLNLVLAGKPQKGRELRSEVGCGDHDIGAISERCKFRATINKGT